MRVGVIEVVQHQTKVSGLFDGFDRPARPAAERSGKLLAAQIGRRKTLPFFHPPRHNILELAGVVRRRGLAGHLKVGLDDVVHILQQQRRTLHDLLGRGEVQFLPPALRGLPDIAGGDLA